MAAQYIIIGVILAVCLAYSGWRIHKAFRIKAGDPCAGCALRKACRKDLR